MADPLNDSKPVDPTSGLRLGLRLHLTLWIGIALAILILARGSLLPDRPGGVWMIAGVLAAVGITLWLPGRLGSSALVVVHSLSFLAAGLVIAELVMDRTFEAEVAHTRYPYPYRMHGFAPDVAPGESERHHKVSTNATGLRG